MPRLVPRVFAFFLSKKNAEQMGRAWSRSGFPKFLSSNFFQFSPGSQTPLAKQMNPGDGRFFFFCLFWFKYLALFFCLLISVFSLYGPLFLCLFVVSLSRCVSVHRCGIFFSFVHYIMRSPLQQIFILGEEGSVRCDNHLGYAWTKYMNVSI